VDFNAKELQTRQDRQLKSQMAAALRRPPLFLTTAAELTFIHGGADEAPGAAAAGDNWRRQARNAM